MAHLVTIQNLTGRQQKAFYNERIESLNPYEVRDVYAPVAGAFIEQRGKYVREYAAVKAPEVLPGQRGMWIANNTGNPFLPKKLYLDRVEKGEQVKVEVDNPVRVAAVIRRVMGGGQRIQQAPKDPSSMECLNLSPSVTEIPPYHRVYVPEDFGRWSLRRDMQQEMSHQGKLVSCRAPTEFEPNISWPLSEIQLYADICDVPKEMFGPSEAEIGEDDARMHEEKARLLNVLFFKLIDDMVNLPLREHFNSYLKQRKKTIGVSLPKVSVAAPEPVTKKERLKAKAQAARASA